MHKSEHQVLFPRFALDMTPVSVTVTQDGQTFTYPQIQANQHGPNYPAWNQSDMGLYCNNLECNR